MKKNIYGPFFLTALLFVCRMRRLVFYQISPVHPVSESIVSVTAVQLVYNPFSQLFTYLELYSQLQLNLKSDPITLGVLHIVRASDDSMHNGNVPAIERNQDYVECFSIFYHFSFLLHLFLLQYTTNKCPNTQVSKYFIYLDQLFKTFFLQNVSNFDFCQKYQKTLIQYKWFKIDFTIFALKLFTQYFVYVLNLQSKDYVFIIHYVTKSKFLKQVSFDRGFIQFLLFNVTGTFLRS